MSEPIKTIKIFASTHTILKVNAAKAGVSIMEYIRRKIDGETNTAPTENRSGEIKPDVPDNNNAD